MLDQRINSTRKKEILHQYSFNGIESQKNKIQLNPKHVPHNVNLCLIQMNRITVQSARISSRFIRTFIVKLKHDHFYSIQFIQFINTLSNNLVNDICFSYVNINAV